MSKFICDNCVRINEMELGKFNKVIVFLKDGSEVCYNIEPVDKVPYITKEICGEKYLMVDIIDNEELLVKSSEISTIRVCNE